MHNFIASVLKKNILLAASAVLFFMLPFAAYAASLGFSPSTGSFEVGKTFTVSVVASSTDASVNAFSGTLRYPREMLEYVSITKSNSIVDQWLPPGTAGPTVRTSDGVINFEGVAIGGFQGNSGELFKVTFKVKKTGTAELAFTSGAVLANDGTGSDVLRTYGTGSYTLKPAVIPVPKPIVAEPVVTETPAAPEEVFTVPVVQVPTGPSPTEVAFQQLAAQMTMLISFTKFALIAIIVLTIALIFLSIYVIHLAIWVKKHAHPPHEH